MERHVVKYKHKLAEILLCSTVIVELKLGFVLLCLDLHGFAWLCLALLRFAWVCLALLGFA
jgi:hypothetical protein